MNPIISGDKEIKLNRFAFHRLYPLVGLAILFFIIVNIFTELGHYGVYAGLEYQLPYPGILPNHRLYPLKAARDRLVEFFTRDLNKKAQLYLHYADKRIYMAKMLSEQKEWALAESTASKAEKYLLKVASTVETLEKMGGSMDVTFVPKIKQAVQKHRQLLNDLLKEAPKEYRASLKEVIKINSEFSAWSKAR